MARLSPQEAAGILQAAFNKEGASAAARAEIIRVAREFADTMPFHAEAKTLIPSLAAIFEGRVRDAFLARLDATLSAPQNEGTIIAGELTPVVRALRAAPRR